MINHFPKSDNHKDVEDEYEGEGTSKPKDEGVEGEGCLKIYLKKGLKCYHMMYCFIGLTD